MHSDLGDLADLALAEVSRFGVDYADVRARREESESVDVRDAAVEGVSRERSEGVGLRVLYGGAWGFAATSSPHPDEVRRAARLAVEVARASAAVPGPSAGLDGSEPVVGSWTTPHLADPLDVPLQDKVALLLSAAAAAKDAADIAYVEVTTDAWRTRTAFRSSEGARIDQLIVQVGGGLTAYAVGGGEVQRRSYPTSFRGQFETGGWERVLALDLVGGAPQAARDAVALLTAPDLPYREDAVLILDSGQVALQVHESIGHAVELDRILGSEAAFAGTSWWASRTGDGCATARPWSP